VLVISNAQSKPLTPFHAPLERHWQQTGAGEIEFLNITGRVKIVATTSSHPEVQSPPSNTVTTIVYSVAAQAGLRVVRLQVSTVA
jgi:hypothetical protein